MDSWLEAAYEERFEYDDELEFDFFDDFDEFFDDDEEEEDYYFF